MPLSYHFYSLDVMDNGLHIETIIFETHFQGYYLFMKFHFFLVSFFMNHHVVLRCIYCITNILIFLYYLFFCGHQTSVAWDMLRVYNDFIDAQERHRYFVESYLGAYVLNFQTLMCSSIKF